MTSTPPWDCADPAGSEARVRALLAASAVSGEAHAWHAADPTNWRATWQRIQDKWDTEDSCPDGSLRPFNIDARQIEPISAALDQLAAQCGPFDVHVRGLGAFKPAGPVRIMWVGLEDPEGHLTRCQALCEQLVSPLGFQPEGRAFHPHLTLGRNNDPRSDLFFVGCIAYHMSAGAPPLSPDPGRLRPSGR